MSDTKSGAELIVQGLIDAGTDVVFGFPGGRVIPLYNVLYDAPIRHILTRHEQGAAHAADGYARTTGRTGVCIATSGPGATNLVTGLATAYMDSVPMVAITGQVSVNMIGNDSFQEADTYGISLPVTKYNYLVKDVTKLPHVIKEAFFIASTGRPGPVLIDVPSDLQVERIKPPKTGPVKLPGYTPVTKGHPKQIEAILQAVKTARRPVIYAGGGVIASGASAELRKFIRKTGIPITTTLMGKGVYPDSDDLNLGMPGMHGTKYSNLAIYDSDLIIAMGVRFDDRVAGDVAKFAPLARVIHIDIDPAEIGKRLATHIPIVGDLKAILKMLNERVDKVVRKTWIDRIAQWKQEHPLTFEDDGKSIKPQAVLKMISDMTKGECVMATDVGQHQMWAALYYDCTEPRRFLTSGGLGTMGYGLPAAMGAQVGTTDLPVLCITGDGSFQMCIQELATIRQYNLPVKILIFNNGCLGMVRQWQEFFYDRRYSHTVWDYSPDFCKIAEGYDIESHRVTDPKDVKKALERALNSSGPILTDFMVAPGENVFPMIPSGGGQTDFFGEGEE